MALSRTAWKTIRERWENDPREGYMWLVREDNLKISDEAIRKKAKSEGWFKKLSLKSVVEQAHTAADSRLSQTSKVAKVGSKVDQEVGAAVGDSVGEPTSTRQQNQVAVDLRADVIQTHRTEWSEHREQFTLQATLTHDDPAELAKIAKTIAETIKIRQEAERKAWGLDAIVEDTTSGMQTLEALDAMFEMAKKKTDAMRESVRAERGLNAAH